MFSHREKMSGRMRHVAIAVLCSGSMLVAAGVVGLGTSAASGATKKAPFVIGADEDLSGLLAGFGTWVRQTFPAVFNSVNAAGGINGHKIDFKILDDQTNPVTALANLKELLADKPVLVTGSTISNFCEALQSTVTKAKVPMSCLFADISQVQPAAKYVYGVNAQEITTALPIANFIQSLITVPSPKAGILVTDTSGSVEGANKIKALLTGDGFDISDYVVSSSTAPPTAAQVAALAGSDPDVIYTELEQSQTESVLEQLRTDGYTGPLVSQAPDYTGLISLADPGYYTYSSTLFVGSNPTGSAAKTYVKEMKSVGVTGLANLNTGEITLDWIRAMDIVAALKKCVAANKGACTSSEMNTAMQETTVSLPGLTSAFGYSTSNHIGFSSGYIYGYNPTTKNVVLKTGPVKQGAL